MVRSAPFDIAIIGGGVNGCGIARDAAGRGLSVYLCEKSDLAGATSSASTKLIHGGLRYLEYYEFRLVREALMEREVLLRAAPHIVSPLRFVLPHHKGLRPAWLIRLGLLLYDHLGGRKILPSARRIDLSKDAAGAPLKPAFRSGFEYSDCWVDDARLVVLNAIDAAARGAAIETRTEMVKAERRAGGWRIFVRDTSGGLREINAKVLVNAAGPWVGEVLSERLGLPLDAPMRLVKGSHIVVPRLFTHDRAYIFQNADQRIVFAIPYEGDFTLIGTTDLDYDGDPGSPRATKAEIDYLCAAASEYFRQPIDPARVVWTYSGVRPLYDDGASAAQEATRDYVLKVEGGGDLPPVLNIYGGKITTYRRLAEAALEKLQPFLAGLGRPWTADAPLPGGDFPVDGLAALAARIASALAPLHAEARGALRARLRHARAAKSWRGCARKRIGAPPFGADLIGARGPLPDGARMGADRGGRALAALEARAAHERARRRAARRLDAHGARGRAGVGGRRRSRVMTLELQNVSKSVRGETHIDHVSLTFARGSLNILLGPTLSGKTSLMRLMAGLDRPTEGRVVFEGKDVTGVPVKQRSVAMVYQQFINYPNLTVYENIASPLRVAGVEAAELDRRVREAAALMKLEPLLQRRPLELSGGQQQRTALARAIVKRADLVLLDEPLANLDYKLREELREELPRIFSATGAIFVYATTEPLEALLLGGSTATLAQRPRHAVRADARGLPAPEQPGDGAHLLRSADEHALGGEGRRLAARCRRRAQPPGDRHLRRASPTPSTRSASVPTISSCFAPRRTPPRSRRKRRDDGDHRLGELRACRFRRRALGGARARRPRAGDRPAGRALSRSEPLLRVRRRRRARRRARHAAGGIGGGDGAHRSRRVSPTPTSRGRAARRTTR